MVIRLPHYRRGAAMTIVDRIASYEALAEECVRAAETTANPVIQRQYRLLAAQWRLLADAAATDDGEQTKLAVVSRG